MPLLSPEIVMNPALLVAVQPQPAGTVIPTTPVPPADEKRSLAGESSGVGFETVIVASDELLPGCGSVSAELTVAVLLIEAPFATEQFTCATMVATCEVFGAMGPKVMVLLLPDPPQTTPAGALHDTKESDDGKLSDTTTDAGVSGPPLLTVSVYVTLDPTTTVPGEA